jgi:hypothetical protein
MELSSTLSTNLWNRSKSTAVSVGCRVGEARAVRSRVPSTRMCRGKIIVGRLCLWWLGGRSGRSNECVGQRLTCGQRVYGGKVKGFMKEESVSDTQAARWRPKVSLSIRVGGCDMHGRNPGLWAVRSETCGLADEWRGWLEG